MLISNVLEAIGGTPTIKLNKIVPEGCADVYVKFEGLCAGGSIKSRTACCMVCEAEKSGEIKKDSILCEATSGNQGIGLAMVGAVKGYKVRIIMPDSVSEERRKLIKGYGAELVLVHDKGDIGAAVDKCIQISKEMAAKDPKVWLCRQFENPDNLLAHQNGTASELLEDMKGIKIDAFCSGIGTGGTLSGIGRTLKKVNPDTIVWAAEPENAAILSGGAITTHIQMGIGDGIIPENLDQDVYDDITTISDEEALSMTRKLMSQEGICCGISSGTNVVAAIRMAKVLGPGKVVVTVLPDTGERYLSTKLFENDEAVIF